MQKHMVEEIARKVSACIIKPTRMIAEKDIAGWD